MLTLRSLQLVFWAKSSSASYFPTFYVGVMTNVNDITSFIPVDTVNVSNNTLWDEYEADLTSYAGPAGRVAIVATTSPTWYAYLDDFTLNVAPPCPTPNHVTLTEVTEARTRATSVTIDPSNMTAEQIQEFQKNWSDLNSSLGRLIAVAESYPELKANENFRDLQNQLEGSENRINEARNKYNAAVTEYNKNIRSFPNNIFAGIFGFKTMEKFAAESGAEKAPKVQF